MVLVPFNLDIAHPPGIPSFSMIGKLFALLPLGGAALRINLMSALAAALAGVVLYLFILRLITLCFRSRMGDGLSEMASVTLAACLA